MATPALLMVVSLMVLMSQAAAATGRTTCTGSKYYDKTLKECCAECPSGFEKRHRCNKDPDKDCKKPCDVGSYINWEQSTPRCTPCTDCQADDDLAEAQPCSANFDAVCKCKTGLYCETPVSSTCARCSPHHQCKPGYRVKHEGNETHDTVCEEQPLGSHTSHSAAVGWKPLTKIPLDQTIQDSVIRGNTERPADVAASHRALTIQRHTTGSRILATSQSDSVLKFTTATEPGETGVLLYPWYVVAGGITCLVILLLITLKIILKAKTWTVKPLLLNQKGFTSCNFASKRKAALLTYAEEGAGDGQLCRETSPPEQELLRKGESSECDKLLRDQDEKRQRDHMTNRIERIYIMKADTVLVGSISETPNQQVTVTTGSQRREAKGSGNPVYASRYPEQESSEVPRGDLMFSVEEEGKAKGHPSSLCV